MRKYLVLICCWVNLSYGVGQDMCDQGLALGKALTGDGVNYQQGATKVSQMRYELEPEKHGQWQQNQQLAPQNLEQEAVTRTKTEAMGRQLIEAESMRGKFDEDVDLDLLAKGAEISQNAKTIIATSGSKSMAVNFNTEYVIKTCEHSRRPETFMCIRYLVRAIISQMTQSVGLKRIIKLLLNTKKR